MGTTPAELEVPGEPGLYRCARHRKETTRVRCGRCEIPICPKCSIVGPAGARCRDCGSVRSSHLYKVSPVHYMLTFFASLILSALASFIVSTIGFFILFYAAFAGTFMGKVAAYITRGKRGAPLALVASAGTVLGALLPFGVLPSLLAPGSSPHPALALMLGAALLFHLANPWIWIYLVLVVPALWYWIK